MQECNKRRLLKSVVISLVMVFVFQAGVVGVHGWDEWGWKERVHGESERGYIQSVLSKHRTGLSSRDEARLAQFIIDESRKNDLDPLLVMALIETESTFYNWAKSHKGAIGLMQVLPSTGKSLAKDLNLGWDGEKTLYDPYKNVRMGIHYYARLLKRYRDSDEKALAAYNAGPTYITARLRRGRAIPKRYGNKVISKYNNLKEHANSGAV